MWLGGAGGGDDSSGTATKFDESTALGECGTEGAEVGTGGDEAGRERGLRWKS